MGRDLAVSAGYVLPAPGDLAPTLPIWSALNGSQLFDAANQKYTIDAEPNVAMLDYFVSWLDEEYKGDFSLVQRSGSWWGIRARTDTAPVRGWQTGDAGQGSRFMGDFYANGEPAFTKWNVASYPVGPGGSKTNSGYWPNWLVIPKGANHPKEGFGYLDYMSGVGVVKWFEAVPDSAGEQAGAGDRAAGGDRQARQRVRRRGLSEFFRRQFDVVTPMWNSPVQSFAQDQLRTTLEAVLQKTAKPKTPWRKPSKRARRNWRRSSREARSGCGCGGRRLPAAAGSR